MRAGKYQQVLALLRKQENKDKLQELNSNKQNMLHVLSINKPKKKEIDVQIKVCLKIVVYSF